MKTAAMLDRIASLALPAFAVPAGGHWLPLVEFAFALMVCCLALAHPAGQGALR